MTPPDYNNLMENRVQRNENDIGMVSQSVAHVAENLLFSRFFFAVAGLVLCVAFVVFGLHQANQIRKLEGEIVHFHAIEEVFWRNNETLYKHESSIYQHDKRIRSLEMKLRQHGIGDLPVRTGDTLPPKEEK